MLVDLVDRADIRVVKSGSSSRFPAKTLQRLRVIGEFVGKELQRDEPTKLRVLGFIDHAHTTASDLLEDAVMRDGLTDHVIEVLTAAVPIRRSRSA